MSAHQMLCPRLCIWMAYRNTPRCTTPPHRAPRQNCPPCPTPTLTGPDSRCRHSRKGETAHSISSRNSWGLVIFPATVVRVQGGHTPGSRRLYIPAAWMLWRWLTQGSSSHLWWPYLENRAAGQKQHKDTCSTPGKQYGRTGAAATTTPGSWQAHTGFLSPPTRSGQYLLLQSAVCLWKWSPL